MRALRIDWLTRTGNLLRRNNRLERKQGVAQSDPIFAGVWSQKEGGGIGGLFIDQSWDELVSKWKQLGSNQYLADVEVYRHNGKFRYAAVWRVVYAPPRDRFLSMDENYFLW